jgi:probable HAF family extracellular repeat protein
MLLWNSLAKAPRPRTQGLSRLTGSTRRPVVEQLEDRCLLTQYLITDLGMLLPPPNANSYATGINNSGQVVGYFHNQGQNDQPFFYDGVNMNVLPVPFGDAAGYANAINNLGQIVGYSNNADSMNPMGHAFVWQNGTYAPPLQGLGGNSSVAVAINDSGLVAGRSEVPTSACAHFPQNFHAVVWDSNVPNAPPDDLMTLGTGAESHAYSINANDQVFGDSSDGQGSSACAPPLAFSYNYPGGPMIDLNPNFGSPTESRVYGSNSLGQTVGFEGEPQMTKAFVMNADGQFANIPILQPPTIDTANQGNAINSSGTVVGDQGYFSMGYQADYAFVWFPAWPNSLVGQVYNPLGLVVNNTDGYWSQLNSATAINDSGQIVGYGTTAAGQTHGYLLTPAYPPAEAGQSPLVVLATAGSAQGAESQHQEIGNSAANRFGSPEPAPVQGSLQPLPAWAVDSTAAPPAQATPFPVFQEQTARDAALVELGAGQWLERTAWDPVLTAVIGV